MATIRYTHGFDLLYQIVFMICSVALTLCIIEILEPLYSQISAAGIGAGLPEWVFTIVGLAGAIAGFAGSAFILLKTILNPTLPTYLYVRWSLLTPVSWKDAEGVAFLFSGDPQGKWYPLRELRKVPKELRRETLLEFAARVMGSGYGFLNSRRAVPPPRATPPPPQRQQVDPAVQEYLTCCSILGVSPNASIEAIKSAYRTKMKQYHPDIYARSKPELRQFAEEKSKLVNYAYAFLIDHYGPRPAV